MNPSFQLEIGHRVRAMPGETVAGDVCHVERVTGGHILALIDGLGHGPAAAAAAQRCSESFSRHSSFGVAQMLAMAHRDLRGTRGAVATVARISEQECSLELAGIGNVSALLIHNQPGKLQKTVPVITPGALGSAFRNATVQRYVLSAGDSLILHSDGVRTRFDSLGIRLHSAQLAAEELIASHGKASDDASCIVMRCCLSEQRLISRAPPSYTGPQRSLPLRLDGDAQVAALVARQFAAELGLSTRAQWEVGIAAAELASNAVKYGGEGTLTLRRVDEPEPALLLEVSDRGLGLGYSSGRAPAGAGLGVGLSSVKRLMDEVAVRAIEGLGTRVMAWKRLQPRT